MSRIFTKTSTFEGAKNQKYPVFAVKVAAFPSPDCRAPSHDAVISNRPMQSVCASGKHVAGAAGSRRPILLPFASVNQIF